MKNFEDFSLDDNFDDFMVLDVPEELEVSTLLDLIDSGSIQMSRKNYYDLTTNYD